MPLGAGAYGYVAGDMGAEDSEDEDEDEDETLSDLEEEADAVDREIAGVLPPQASAWIETYVQEATETGRLPLPPNTVYAARHLRYLRDVERSVKRLARDVARTPTARANEAAAQKLRAQRRVLNEQVGLRSRTSRRRSTRRTSAARCASCWRRGCTRPRRSARCCQPPRAGLEKRTARALLALATHARHTHIQHHHRACATTAAPSVDNDAEAKGRLLNEPFLPLASDPQTEKAQQGKISGERKHRLAAAMSILAARPAGKPAAGWHSR